jgi:hypothetical protein
MGRRLYIYGKERGSDQVLSDLFSFIFGVQEEVLTNQC